MGVTSVSTVEVAVNGLAAGGGVDGGEGWSSAGVTVGLTSEGAAVTVRRATEGRGVTVEAEREGVGGVAVGSALVVADNTCAGWEGVGVTAGADGER